jgi:hypothetical protein
VRSERGGARGAVRRDLLSAVRALDELERILQLGRRGAVAAPEAVSKSDIGLDPSAATATTSSSVEKVNAIPYSFAPCGPLWCRASDAALVLDGDYDGANGTDTLTFQVEKGGTHGADNLKIGVEDGGGKKIGSFNINPSDPLDEVYTLTNGMAVTLGAGDLVKNDTLTVNVSDTVGTAVDPDRPLDGTGSDDARLEYALVVGPGSFSVNGVDIDVFSGDSLNDVLARITSSAAGVDATFDAASERVLLSQKTPGSGPGIVLGPDSSGFVAATKLDTAVATPGTDHEPSIVLAALPQFSGVSSGAITVNGVDIDIDVNADSLVDVLDRISTSSANALATLSASAQRVTIAGTNATNDLSLEQGSTGLFTALFIDEGT